MNNEVKTKKGILLLTERDIRLVDKFTSSIEDYFDSVVRKQDQELFDKSTIIIGLTIIRIVTYIFPPDLVNDRIIDLFLEDIKTNVKIKRQEIREYIKEERLKETH